MAISFEESKQQLASTMAAAATPRMMAMTYAAGDSWTKPTNSSLYTYYNNEYSDNKISTVDENKNITLSQNQINLTQEKNSQYIPFEIPRYYDGFDLSNTELSIYWVNQNGNGSVAIPVDVYYNTDKIRFAWLVDDDVTAIAGNIKFEIQATGTNSKGYNYVWKTKASDGLNVLQALEIQGFIEPDETWQESFVQRLAEQVRQAENAKSVAVAAAEDAKQVAAELQDGLADEVATVIGGNYYTKTEVDEALANVTVDLTGYATERYVDNAIAAIPETDLTDYALKTDIPTNVSEFTNDAGYLTEHQSLAGLATEQYVKDAVAKVDVSEQLKDYALKTELPTVPTNVSEFTNDAGYLTEHQSLDDYALKTEIPSIDGLATEDYVKNAVAAVDVSEQLKGYAKSTEVDAKVNELKVSVNTNTSSISSLSTTVTDLQEKVNSIDTSPRLTYDATYNTEGDYSFVLYEIQNEGDSATEVRSEKAKFVIQGGGGSGGTSSTLKIEYVTPTPLVVTTNDSAIITYNFSGTDSSGDAVLEGTATWKVGGKIVATNTAVAGQNSFDVTEYLSLGTQKVQLSVTDAAGSLVTKTWTVQKVDIRLESTFNDKIIYPIDTVSFDYTPYGAIPKDVHFILDGSEIGMVNTAASGLPMAYTIPAQYHGTHLLEVYITATINNNLVESNHIYKDIMWYDSESNIPLISCTQQNFTALQYDSTNIIYTVFDPNTETPTVTLAVDDVVVSTLTLESSTNTWQYKATDPGSHTLTITCGSTVKTLHATIEKLNINVEPVTAGLEFDFNPVGKSNNDADRLWSDGEVTMTVSDNFDWVNGGYQIDENGDQYFCVKSGTTATINYNLFADDPKKNGKEFKVVFKSTNVRKRETSFITCMNGGIGLDMKVESANIYSSNGSLYSPYCEEDIIEFEFNINKDTDIPMVLTYEDGVANRPMIYTSDATFMQTTPQPITIGSEDCDVYIYRMKAYSTSLTDRGILSNFIADARNADEMIARYNRNQIYDENGLLTPEVLAEKCPDLRIIMVDAPWFTNDKKNKVSDTTVTMIYKNGDSVLDNWTCTGASHSGQGTSSNEYGYAGRNIDLIMNNDTSLFTLGDGITTSKTITLTRDSVPTNYLNVKVRYLPLYAVMYIA